jgi:hypothetical protein
VDDGEEIGRREIGGWCDFLAVDAEFGARFDFVTDVDFGSGVVTDEDDGESGRSFEGGDAGSEGGEDLVAYPLAVEGLGGNLWVRIAEG